MIEVVWLPIDLAPRSKDARGPRHRKRANFSRTERGKLLLDAVPLSGKSLKSGFCPADNTRKLISFVRFIDADKLLFFCFLGSWQSECFFNLMIEIDIAPENL